MGQIRLSRMIVLGLLLVAAGCHNSPQDEAREKLVGEMGVRWSPETFIQAAMNGDTQVVSLFLQAGMDPDAAGDEGKTALIWAATNGHTATVQTLLDNGADVNAIDKQGKTALMWATEGDHDSVVQALLAQRANVGVKALDGSTALSIARRKGDTELVRLFEQAGAQ